MIPDSFDHIVGELLRAIVLCLDSKLIIPSQMLLYSGIDTLGWLAIPDTTSDASGASFRRWADDYLLAPGSNLSCTSTDLWAARCGLLHKRSSDSQHTISGKARRIMYAWGDRTSAELQELIELHPAGNAVAVHVDDMVNAFARGVSRFRDDVGRNDEIASIVANKLARVFPSATQRDRLAELVRDGFCGVNGLE